MQILSGRQNDKRRSETNLAVTLLSIVVMHILCNALRVLLGVLVVALVGQIIIKCVICTLFSHPFVSFVFTRIVDFCNSFLTFLEF